MKKLFLLSITIFGFLNVYSQYEAQAIHYWLDQPRINPGSVGSKDMVCASLIVQDNTMFSGFPGGLRDVFVNANAPFNLFGAKHGVGLSFLQETIGFNTDIKFSLSYAYRQPMGDGHLGIGVGVEGHQHSLKPTWVGNDSYNPEEDDFVPKENENLFGVNLSTGIFYRSEDIYFGLAAKNIFSPKVIEYKTSSTSTGNATTGGSSAELLLTPHYTATAGYTMQLNNPAFEYTPSMLITYEGSSIILDFNNMITYNKKFWGGVTYRHAAAVVGMFGLTIYDDVRISFAYEAKTSALATYGGNTIELVLNYCFKMGVEKAPQKYRSIRYL